MDEAAAGSDFGTTSSSVARADRTGEVELVRFRNSAGLTDAYRSLLYLEQAREGNGKLGKS